MQKKLIFSNIIQEPARNTFEELVKIFRKKGGSFEIFDFNLSNSETKVNLFVSSSIIKTKGKEPEGTKKNSKEKPSEPEEPQNQINRNFNDNFLKAISNVLREIESKKAKAIYTHTINQRGKKELKQS